MNSGKKQKIVIVGAGEFAEIAYEYFTHDSEFEVVAFSVEKSFIKESKLFGLPVIPFEELETKYSPANYKAFVAVTFTQLNRIRTRLYQETKKKGFQLVSYRSSKAFIWHNAIIGENCFIFENNVIQYHVKIGNNVILWSGNHIGHRSIIGDNCFLSSHVVVCNIGKSCFFGVNSTIGDTLNVGDDSMIGAGAVLVRNAESGKIYIGSPAKPLPVGTFEKFNLKN
jgi:sugar O-acyltransferase (sialic acid O-acetyltransferase NeuD family)